MIDYITYDEFKKTDLYKSFILENPDISILKINAFSADFGFPSVDTNISIVKKIGNYNVLFFSGVTDSSGVINNIVLPAPKGSNNILETPKYTIYELSANHSGYVNISNYDIGIIGGVNVIQYLNMIPEVNINV